MVVVVVMVVVVSGPWTREETDELPIILPVPTTAPALLLLEVLPVVGSRLLPTADAASCRIEATSDCDESLLRVGVRWNVDEGSGVVVAAAGFMGMRIDMGNTYSKDRKR